MDNGGKLWYHVKWFNGLGVYIACEYSIPDGMYFQ